MLRFAQHDIDEIAQIATQSLEGREKIFEWRGYHQNNYAKHRKEGLIHG
jgi:hypothetical protein